MNVGRLNRLFYGLVLIGIIGVIEFWPNYSHERKYVDHGAIAPATPLGARGKSGEAYHGDLVFHTKDGQEIIIQASQVPPVIQNSFQMSNSVDVQYLPEDPQIHRFSEWHQTTSFKELLLALTLMVLGIVGVAVMRNQKK